MQPVKSARTESRSDASLSLKERVLAAVRSVLPADRQEAALHEPWFNGRELEYVQDCIRSGWVSSVGSYVSQFETKLSEYLGAKRAIVVVNGTSALHLTLKAAGVEQGDEVLLPDLTFVATANAVDYCGAVPHLIDSEERTLGVDAVKLNRWLAETAHVKNGVCINRSTGRRIRALIAVNIFGHPVDADALLEVTQRYHLTFVEDAAQSLGSLYKGRKAGNLGDYAVVSFNGNKILTTGGGGAVITNDETAANVLKHLSTTARTPTSERWKISHDPVGYNYRMPNLNAALGVAQLEQLDGFVQNKRRLAKRYQDAFGSFEELRFFSETSNVRSNYWLNAILLNRGSGATREELLNHFNANGIQARAAWTLMHKLPMFAECPRMDVSTAVQMEASVINLPSSAFLATKIHDT